MGRKRWSWGWVIGVLLLGASTGQAQEEPEQSTKLDRLPTWHPTNPTTGRRRSSRPSSSEATEYATIADLIQQRATGKRIEALILTGPVIGYVEDKLLTLLPHIRVLTLKNVTAGQVDSLFGQARRWSRLERLTIDITDLGSGRPYPKQLVRLPMALQHCRKLHDLLIREDGLDWSASLPVLAGIKALRRLEIDHWGQTAGSQQPVLTTLRQVSVLHLRNSGWLITPETIGDLPRLRELSLSSLSINGKTVDEVLRRLPALETLRLTKCWQIEKMAVDNLTRLKTVELAYNDKLVIDSALVSGFTSVEQLTIKGGQLSGLTGLSNLIQLRYLNVMGGRQSIRLPDAIDNLKQLTDLRLYDLRLGSLPSRFGLLPRLQTLRLNQCGLDSLPVSFGQLTTLETLTLYGNKLRQLSGLENFKNLRQLNVSGNQLTILPDGVGQLTKLTKLNVSENQLTELPASLTWLKRLEQLTADHNRLGRLPDELDRLTRLTDLSIHLNQLVQLPASLTRLTNLVGLSVAYNRLGSLPNDLGKLRKLSSLSLGNNQLTALPGSLGQLRSLRYLWIGQNHLRELPPGLGQLRNLTDLTIDANELTALPADLSGLQQLTTLSLTKLPLTELPVSVGALGNLQTLIITDTRLRALPNSIGALTNLRYVRLSNNPLVTLPNPIGRWQSVTTLDLSGTDLEYLPNGIGRMTRLTELMIRAKTPASTGATGKLRQLPDSIVFCDQLQALTIEQQPQLDANDVFRKAAGLKNLHELTVTDCRITHLPDLMWKNVAWQKLNVAQNRLTDLPAGLLDAPELRSVRAHGNQLPASLNTDFVGKQALLSAIVGSAGTLPTNVVDRSKSELTEALLRTANEKGSVGDWAGAVSALNQAITYAPDSMRALPYRERASLYEAHKQYANALTDLDSAIAYMPKLHYSGLSGPAILEAHWTWKGRIFAAIGQYENALASVAQADRLLPANPFPEYAQSVGSNELERSRYLMLQGNLPAAESSYRRAIDAYQQAQRSHVGISLMVVEICLLTEQYDRAKQLLGRIPNEDLKQGYGTLKAYLSACLAILEGSKTGDQAIVEFDAFRDDDPQRQSWRFSLTDTWLEYKHIDAQKIKAFRQLQNAARLRLREVR